MLFGGIDIFDMNNTALVQEYYVVEWFAIILGRNGIFAGISWIIYVILHNTWNWSFLSGSIFFVVG